MGPENAEAATLVLRDGVILLGAAMLFVTLFRRFGLGAVLGYIVAGALVGPHGGSAILMGREALGRFSVSEEEVQRVEAEFRRRDLERLESQSTSGDLHATKHLMFKPDRALPDEERQAAPQS